MLDREKVIKGLKTCYCPPEKCEDCPYYDIENCNDALCLDALALLKDQEVRELSINEWEEWKANPKRNPICELWENDTSPMWILNPDKVHEPALLMGKLKLFTGKPTFGQCKAIKWK